MSPRTQTSHDGLVALIADQGVSDRVVAAFRATDRAGFVPPEAAGRPYADRPIEIGAAQTTSQPSLIARMIDAADLLPGDTVLEVGTGLGFQTAVLARLTGSVVSIERHEALARLARANLERAAISGAEVIVADGWEGWKPGSPYEAIVVSAAAEEVPPAFATQLVPGGRLVIPLRAPIDDEVVVFIKRGDHLVRTRVLTPARFVPLVRGAVPDQSNE